MRSKPIIVFVAILFACSGVFGQNGGKAEPSRIQFSSGKSSIILLGTLSNSQEMEYVFAAKKGQTVTMKMSNTNLFDYRVFNPDADFETEFESSTVSTFELPETGDYLLFVRKKQSKSRSQQNSVYFFRLSSIKLRFPRRFDQ